MTPKAAVVFSALAAAATLAVIIAGFFVIGSPSEVRMRRLDAIRAQDLNAISNAITGYRRTHESLPRTLDDLAPGAGTYVLYRLKDPTGRPYEYQPTDAYGYQLCASFDRGTERPELGYGQPIFATHGKGRQCFSLQARPPVQH